MWIIYAFGSAFFAGITSILAKCGIRKTDSDVATAIRTIVVLIFAWMMVFIVGSQDTILEVSNKAMIFLVLSGLSTGASWICYFKALQKGNINKVVPIDKSSTILTMLLAILFLNEPVTAVTIIGMLCIGFGTMFMIEQKKVKSIVNAKEVTVSQENVLQETVLQEMVLQETVLHETELQEAKVQNIKIKDIKEHNLERDNKWLLYAVLSAVFASLTSILGKVGIGQVDSTLGTAIRTIVILIMAWVVVYMTGKQKQVKAISRKEFIFIVLSGIATGVSWLFYYRALQDGLASIVVPIDKLSILVSISFSYFVFKEKLSMKAMIGLILIIFGTLIMLL